MEQKIIEALTVILREGHWIRTHVSADMRRKLALSLTFDLDNYCNCRDRLQALERLASAIEETE